MMVYSIKLEVSRNVYLLWVHLFTSIFHDSSVTSFPVPYNITYIKSRIFSLAVVCISLFLSNWIVLNSKCVYLCVSHYQQTFFFVALRPNGRHGLLIVEVSRSQTTHQSAGLLWTSNQLDAETSTWQNTQHSQQTSMPPGGIRTHDLSRRAAADLRLRPCGHWDRHQHSYVS